MKGYITDPTTSKPEGWEAKLLSFVSLRASRRSCLQALYPEVGILLRQLRRRRISNYLSV
ncbi:Uncharacterized protein TCM_037669 [Theobroma cacao]|uniref:Uncharacterized protein n=1 Tax=Theobroma cacao TaxID=3641 RepID=A0A061GMS6_THECC|nr:Uncharacterized protein TCM_037669 [Theobroma cacao]